MNNIFPETLFGTRFQYFPVVDIVDFLPNEANEASIMIDCGDFSLTTGDRHVSDGEVDDDDDDL